MTTTQTGGETAGKGIFLNCACVELPAHLGVFLRPVPEETLPV